MAKGFTDDKGRFRPTGNKGVSSRTKSISTEGLEMSKIQSDVDITTEEIEFQDKLIEIEADIEANFDDILFKTALNKRCDFKEGKLIRTKLTKDDQGLLPEGTQIEEFCGAVTDELGKFITKKYGKGIACEERGVYTGDDKENSAGFNRIAGEVQHEWIRLPDGTIIDASAGQFVEDKDSVTNEDRLRIISPEDPRQDWYNPNSKMCNLCGARLIAGKCPSPDVDAIMKLVNTGLTVDEAKEKIASEGS
ncbi:MAG: hypothetical protein KJI69_04260 [Patescibacteria group bacterium]|nr:hypothetical protein [Patescibacteria group bacterium]